MRHQGLVMRCGKGSLRHRYELQKSWVLLLRMLHQLLDAFGDRRLVLKPCRFGLSARVKVKRLYEFLLDVRASFRRCRSCCGCGKAESMVDKV